MSLHLNDTQLWLLLFDVKTKKKLLNLVVLIILRIFQFTKCNKKQMWLKINSKYNTVIKILVFAVDWVMKLVVMTKLFH